MPKIQQLRALAYRAQHGRCCYCGTSMWLSAPEELGLRPRSAKPFQCTAEHLMARQDGGRDSTGNIADACWLCNHRRHQRKSPPSPDAYKALVQRRVAKGKWR